MRARIGLGVIALACGVLLASPGGASGDSATPHADYDLSWWNADGTNGVLNGGRYTLMATAGEPDAAGLAGGPYTLSGGFWAAGVAENIVYLPVVVKSP